MSTAGDSASAASNERKGGLFRRRNRTSSYDSESDGGEESMDNSHRRTRLFRSRDDHSIDGHSSRGRRLKSISKTLSGITRRHRSLSNDGPSTVERRRARFARNRDDISSNSSHLPNTVNLSIGTEYTAKSPRKGILGRRTPRSLDETLESPLSRAGPSTNKLASDGEEEDGMLAIFQKRQVSFETKSETRPKLERNSSNQGLAASVNSNLDRTAMSTMSMSSTRARYSVHEGMRHGKKKYRVRPYHSFPEPVNLTEEEIYLNSTEPSRDFEQVKSYIMPSAKNMRKIEVDDTIKFKFGTPAKDGRIGSCRVEILGCIGISRTKPDVAAYFVCGDGAFCSDVITGYRSPMWPNVSKRAALFPVHHAYAKLYVGIFDVKARKNKENDVFCGRVVIDLASLRPDTEFDVTFPLRNSSVVYDRKKRGVVRLRFSIHWFSERAAVMSYLQTPRSLLKNQPLVSGFPTIPCADPKTYRNIAVTTYGQDLPGKYSKTAFRATMREFSLYNQNLRAWIKNLGYDTVLYERPLRSLYLFLAGMHCVWAGSVRLVPAYLIGFILILYYQSYLHFVENDGFNLGYKPLTITEIFRALITNSHEQNFKAIAVTKLAKLRKRQDQRQLKRVASDASQEDGRVDCNLDHREFPFSERDTYPRFSVEEAIAPGKGKGGNQRLHGRLSVYYSKSDDELDINDEAALDDEDSSGEDSEGDDETIASEGNMGDDIFDDLEDEEGLIVEEDHMENHVDFTAAASNVQSKNPVALILRQGVKSQARRLRVGPPQNNDTTSGNKVPPQVQLKRMENILHKFTKRISVEPVHAPLIHMENGQPVARRSSLVVTTEAIQQLEKEKKKAVHDEFDRLLGMYNFGSNPITKITATFLGPLMRIIRIVVYICRVAFNTTTWRDPFLSFWVFLSLVVLCLVLVVFPWRLFFGMCVVGGVGPQNLLVRFFLERKAAKKAREEADAKAKAMKEADPYGYGYATNDNDNYGYGETHAPEKSAPAPPVRGETRKNTTRRHRKGSGDVDPSFLVTARQPFSSEFYGATSPHKKMAPRSIAIPYSRLKKDRFYDWPPDPTVSKATPLSWMTGPEAEEVSEISIPEDVMDQTVPNPSPTVGTEGLRRRERGRRMLD